MIRYSSFSSPLPSCYYCDTNDISYRLSTSTCVHNYCFVQLIFQAVRRRVTNKNKHSTKVFGNFLCIYPCQRSLFLHVIPVTLCCLLISAWRIHLSISDGAGFLERSSLCFCLSRKVLMFLYFLKDGFAGHCILSWYPFSFSIVHTSLSFHCFLAAMVSGKKSIVNLMQDSLYVMRCFSLDAFGVLFLSLDS